jgi:hypothetical protein
MDTPNNGKLKTFDPADGKFECAGKIYFITQSLSFDRYEKLRELTIEMGYSASFSQIFDNLMKAWTKLNENKLADGAVIIHNIMNGIKKLEKKYDVAFRICALFINEEDEDPTIYDEEKQNEKISDWSKEYDVAPFFDVAISLVKDWLPAYEIVLNNNSKTTDDQQNPAK